MNHLFLLSGALNVSLIPSFLYFKSGLKSIASKICWRRVGKIGYEALIICIIYYKFVRWSWLSYLSFSLTCLLLLLPEHKLFVGMLPKNVTDAEMTDLFSQYGNIKDLQILIGSQQASKGIFILWGQLIGKENHLFTFVTLSCIFNFIVNCGCCSWLCLSQIWNKRASCGCDRSSKWKAQDRGLLE